jgi:signal transduction histidine kinase
LKTRLGVVIAICLVPMIGGQVLLADSLLPPAIAITGSTALAVFLAVICGHLLLPGPMRIVVQENALPDHRRISKSSAPTALPDLNLASDSASRQSVAGEIVGGIAHDLNNLLATALGCIELMDRRWDDPDRLRGLAARADDSLERAAKLTSSLVQFAHRQPQPPRPTDLNALVADLHPLISSALGRRIRVHTELEAGIDHAQADAAALQTALLGICFAMRAAIADGGQIALTTRGGIAGPSLSATALSITITSDDSRIDTADLDLSNVWQAAEAAGAAIKVTRRAGQEPGQGCPEVSLLLPRAQ